MKFAVFSLVLMSLNGFCAAPEISGLLQFREELQTTIEQFGSQRFMNAQELNLLNELYAKQSPVYFEILNDTEDVSKLLEKRVLSSEEELTILKNATLDSLAIDQITTFYLPLEKNGKFRRQLNEQDQSYDKLKNSFRKLLKAAYANGVINNLLKSGSIIAKYEKSENSEARELVSLLKKTSLFQDQTPGKLAVRAKMGEHFVADGFVKAARGTLYGLSKFFGNIVGRFESRKGYLWEDKVLENNLANTLEPLDVLLEKTPFRMTDRFIPGHWGHAAIYVGNQKQLTELGLWDHPAVVPHHQRIIDGAVIVEALRPGVQINTIAHFLNIDDLAVQRYKQTLSLADKQEYLVRTFKQIGKKYDFAFDAQSGKTIVCSELPYLIFKDVNFNTEVAMGRPNVTPDHISAQSLGDNAEFDLLLFIHDGKVVNEGAPALLGSFLKN